MDKIFYNGLWLNCHGTFVLQCFFFLFIIIIFFFGIVECGALVLGYNTKYNLSIFRFLTITTQIHLHTVYRLKSTVNQNSIRNNIKNEKYHKGVAGARRWNETENKAKRDMKQTNKKNTVFQDIPAQVYHDRLFKIFVFFIDDLV